MKCLYTNFVSKLVLAILFIPAVTFSEENLRGLLTNADIKLSKIYSNRWAFVIGIDEYNYFPTLEYAAEDAKSMKSLLTSQFDFPEENIILLLNEEATKDGIEDGFYRLIEKSKPGDCVVFFFAGHGDFSDKVNS